MSISYTAFKKMAIEGKRQLYVQGGELCFENKRFFTGCFGSFFRFVSKMLCWREFNMPKVAGFTLKNRKWVYVEKNDRIFKLVEQALLKGNTDTICNYVRYLEESALEEMQKKEKVTSLTSLKYEPKAELCEDLVHHFQTIFSHITTLKKHTQAVPVDSKENMQQHFQLMSQSYEEAKALLKKFETLNTLHKKLDKELSHFSYVVRVTEAIPATGSLFEAQEVCLKHLPKSDCKALSARIEGQYQIQVRQYNKLISGVTKECEIQSIEHLNIVCKAKKAALEEMNKKIQHLEQLRQKHKFTKIPTSNPGLISKTIAYFQDFLAHYNPAKNCPREAIQLLIDLDTCNVEFLRGFAESECRRVVEMCKKTGKNVEMLALIRPESYSRHGVIKTSGILGKIDATVA